MEIIVGWIVLSILVGVFASSRGRSGVGFFFLSLLISPLIGFIVALIVQPNQAAVEARQIRDGKEKKCPYCAELIKAEAVVCRFCGKDQESPPAEPEPEPEPEPPLITDQYKPRPHREKRRRARAGSSAWAALIWLAVAGTAALILITAATR